MQRRAAVFVPFSILTQPNGEPMVWYDDSDDSPVPDLLDSHGLSLRAELFSPLVWQQNTDDYWQRFLPTAGPSSVEQQQRSPDDVHQLRGATHAPETDIRRQHDEQPIFRLQAPPQPPQVIEAIAGPSGPQPPPPATGLVCEPVAGPSGLQQPPRAIGPGPFNAIAGLATTTAAAAAVVVATAPVLSLEDYSRAATANELPRRGAAEVLPMPEPMNDDGAAGGVERLAPVAGIDWQRLMTQLLQFIYGGRGQQLRERDCLLVAYLQFVSVFVCCCSR